MTLSRIIPIAIAVASASTLIACTTAPAMPMGASTANSMATPDRMAAMDSQMKSMQAVRTKMMNAKTADERQALMAEHMKAMQDGMAMMGGMGGTSGAGMGDMKGMQGMSGDMGARHQMMEKHMEMMQVMMTMMKDRLPPTAGKQ